MTAVAEQEDIKEEIRNDEIRDDEIRLDIDLDRNIEWEVETEPAPEPMPEADDSETYTGYYNDDSGIRVARSFNKHLFVWVFSFVCGIYGVDRFVRGQIALGVFKVLTFGGLGFWYLIDLIIAIVKAYAGEYRDMDDLLFDEYGRYIY